MSDAGSDKKSGGKPVRSPEAGNKMWGGRFSSGPDAIMEAINASIDFDRKLYAQDIAGSKAHAAMLARQNIISAEDATSIIEGLNTILSEIERGEFVFSAQARRHSHECRGAPCRTHRPGGRPAAHRPFAQRPGGAGFPPLGEAGGAARKIPDARADRGVSRQGGGACGNRDARLHPSADRAARHLRPSLHGLCRNACARPLAPCRRDCAHGRMPARRGCARRHVLSGGPPRHRASARLPRTHPQFPRFGLRPRLRAGLSFGWHRSAPCTCRALPRKSSSGRRRNSASCGCPTASRPARRSCRRRRTPMLPNWCAPRPAASTAHWSPC